MELPFSKKNQTAKAKTGKQNYIAEWFWQYYSLTVPAVCLALFLAGFFFLLAPKWSAARALVDNDLKEAGVEREKLEKEYRFVSGLALKRDSLGAGAVRNLSQIIPDGPEIPSFFATLEAITREAGAILESIELASVDREAAGDPRRGQAPASKFVLPANVRAIEANLSFSASPYGDLKDILGKIETSLRLVDVVALLYSPTARAYTVTVRTYYQESD